MHRQIAKPGQRRQPKLTKSLPRKKSPKTVKKSPIATRSTMQTIQKRPQLLATNTSPPQLGTKQYKLPPTFTLQRHFSADSQVREIEIIDLISQSFQPVHFEVKDVSGGCGAFYHVTVVSNQFENKLTLHRHRAVQTVLKDVIPKMHGLTLFTYTPEQWTKMQKENQDSI